MALFGKRRRDALKNVHAERDAFLRRAGIAVLFCIAGVVLLVVRLSDLQIVEHQHYQTRADENRMRVTPVAPVRGLTRSKLPARRSLTPCVSTCLAIFSEAVFGRAST